jgi:hypothetical protein
LWPDLVGKFQNMSLLVDGRLAMAAARVVLSDVLGSKDVVEGRDGRTDALDSYRTYSCKNGITCPNSFLCFIPR